MADNSVVNSEHVLFELFPFNDRIGNHFNRSSPKYHKKAGLMPEPILLGTIIDTTCSVWQDTCGERGSCWVYSKYEMGVRITLWFMGLKVMGCLLFFISSVVYRPPPAEETLETVIRVPSVTARLDMNRKGYGGVDFHNSDTEPPESNTTSDNGTRL